VLLAGFRFFGFRFGFLLAPCSSLCAYRPLRSGLVGFLNLGLRGLRGFRAAVFGRPGFHDDRFGFRFCG